MGEISDMYKEAETSREVEDEMMSYEPRDGREWLDPDGCFLFGKCKDENVEDVARNDPSYLRWILENVEDINHEDRDVIETSLRFRKRG